MLFIDQVSWSKIFWKVHKREREMGIQQFCTALEQLVAQVTSVSPQPSVILGDFNSDCLHGESPVVERMRKMGFKQIINEPTIESGTCIDHVYVPCSNLEAGAAVRDCYYSDHQKTFVTIKK